MGYIALFRGKMANIDFRRTELLYVDLLVVEKCDITHEKAYFFGFIQLKKISWLGDPRLDH